MTISLLNAVITDLRSAVAIIKIHKQRNPGIDTVRVTASAYWTIVHEIEAIPYQERGEHKRFPLKVSGVYLNNSG